MYEHFRLFTIDPKDSPFICWLCLLLDFGYYWYHRTLHEWLSAHSVHHSGEDYNTAVGLRQVSHWLPGAPARRDTNTASSERPDAALQL